MSDLAESNERLLRLWGGRITKSGSAAMCLIAVRGGADPLHIIFPSHTAPEEMAKLLAAALGEVKAEKLKAESRNQPQPGPVKYPEHQPGHREMDEGKS